MILVVGGHGLIGSAVVSALRQEGATVIPASRHAPEGVTMDARSDESVTKALNEIRCLHGRVDGLVVTAAQSARTLHQSRNSDPDQVARAVEDKAMSFLRLANAILPPMVEAGYGRVVGVSGQNAFQTGNITGSVRDAARVVTAKNLADAVAGSGVKVNAVSPGIVVDEPSGDIRLGRGGQRTPADVANLVTFPDVTAERSGLRRVLGCRAPSPRCDWALTPALSRRRPYWWRAIR
ncbi:SDR family oxidoreductase [Microbacterium invictum]|uniref:NAD(P)-dependent dehydrogenase (Short-subunit alcohol dehydrogenase family) n=1 Tax=Microbacterium invictum TaxID=515415 RepID=A0AA40VN07_9MICO|nr:SDR family oxidoreductase [Microbacterium invictum]MBB4140284.1 NAD(P)-dependent dehydrogenase (short-subunit alcohol dehydrogenase family) [Microbacterium invictum]